MKFELSTSGETTDALKNISTVRCRSRYGTARSEVSTWSRPFPERLDSSPREDRDGGDRRDEADPFLSLTASAQIDDGIATSKDLQATSDVLKISGSGRLDLVKDELDYVLRAQMTASPLGADKRIVSSLLGYTVPIKYRGPLDSLSYRVDWVAVGADMVTRRALGGVGTPVIEEAVKGLGGLLGGKKNR